jgi:hypothetical protein
MTSSQLETDDQEDKIFLNIVLVMIGLGIVATLVALKVMHISFKYLPHGQLPYKINPPFSVSTPSSVATPTTVGGGSASPRVTNKASNVPPSPSSIPQAPRPSQTDKTGIPVPTISIPLPTPTHLLPSLSLPPVLPSLLPTVSLGLHLG